MRCHPRRWLWGILPIAILTWIAVLAEHERIEKDLRVRTEQAFASNGLTAVTSNFNGRDGAVVGQFGAGQADRAEQIALGVWGVRDIESRTTATGSIKSYVWSASIRNDRLKLSGFVPNEATQKTILGVAKAAFPKTEIIDRMKYAPGNVAQATWLAGVSFSLEQLSRLRRGTVYLDGERLSAAGVAATPADYREFKMAMTSKRPSGIAVASDRVSAASVKPFLWEAKVQDNQLVLEGFVPSDAIKASLADAANRSGRYAQVIDKTEVASGADDAWGEAAALLLRELGRLKSGWARFNGETVKIDGVTASDGDLDAMRRGIEAGLPKVFAPALSVRSEAAAETKRAEAELERQREQEKREADARERERVAAEARAIEAEKKTAALVAQRQAEERRQAEIRELAAKERERLKSEADARETARVADEQRRLEQEAERRRQAEQAEEAAKAAAAQAQAVATAQAAAAKPTPDAAVETALRDPAPPVAPRAPLSPEANQCQQSLNQIARRGVIEFERSSADLASQSLPALNELAKVASLCRDVRIEVEGHTDAEGTPERNLKLSDRRARSVVSHLTRQGVESDRLRAIGYGETRPVASNETGKERARNRRIEFTVLMK